MKKFRTYIITLFVVIVAVTACKDEDQELVPAWESGVHGLAAFAPGSPQSFVFQDPSVDLDINLRWVSIDDKNTVQKIEVFAQFNEAYIDPDGNPSTAAHGGDEGRLLYTFEGAAVPADSEDLSFTIDQDDIYQLYKNNTFDYDKDASTAATPVFSNPAKPDRSTASPFVSGDAFKVLWRFTTADGRVFDKWGVSVCTEFPGANCSVDFGVICVSDLAGTYNAHTDWVDYYGDPASVDYTTVVTEFQLGGAPVAGKYLIEDLSGGMEPTIWSNPEVTAVFTDACGTLTIDNDNSPYLDDYSYGYTILAGSKVNGATGVITILWENDYGEHGTTVLTPQ